MSRARATLDALPPPPPETLADRATYWQYRSLWAGVAALPDPLAAALPARLGPVWHAAADGQRAQVRSHVARLLPAAGPDELDATTRAAFTSYARYWVDSFRLHRLDPDEVTARTTGENLGQLDEALARGGAVLATAHLGSWDLAALWATARGWPLTVVAEVVEPRRLFDRFVTLRRDAGLGVVPLVRGGDMVDQMVDVVQGGGLATLLADRDIGGRGPVVDLLGEPCRMPRGSAEVALRTGCPVAVGAVVETGPRAWHAVLQGGLLDLDGMSVEQGTQAIADRLGQLLRRYPAQWHVFVRQFLAEREPEHPAVAAWRADPDGWRARRPVDGWH